MRYRVLTAMLLASAASCLAQSSHAQQTSLPSPAAEQVQGEAISGAVVITPELVQAYQAYKIAQLRWQQYRWVELPRQRQLLDHQIQQLSAQVRVFKRRVSDYRPFLQVGRYSPVRTAAENDRLTLQATEQALRQLKSERIGFVRLSRQNAQLYELDVLQSAVNVRQAMAQAPRMGSNH